MASSLDAACSERGRLLCVGRIRSSCCAGMRTIHGEEAPHLFNRFHMGLRVQMMTPRLLLDRSVTHFTEESIVRLSDEHIVRAGRSGVVCHETKQHGTVRGLYSTFSSLVFSLPRRSMQQSSNTSQASQAQREVIRRIQSLPSQSLRSPTLAMPTALSALSQAAAAIPSVPARPASTSSSNSLNATGLYTMPSLILQAFNVLAVRILAIRVR